MARKVREKVAVQPAQGRKITFGDDTEEYPDAGMEAGPSKPRGPFFTEEEDGDSDEAPEAVNQSKARLEVQQDRAKLAHHAKAQKEAKAARSKAIKQQKAVRAQEDAAAKAKHRPNAPGTKKRRRDEPSSGESDDEEEEEVEGTAEEKRLRKRMEAAMEDAEEEDSEEDEEVEGDEEEAETKEEKRLKARMEAAMAQADDESDEDEEDIEEEDDIEMDEEDYDEEEDEDEEGASFHTASEEDDDGETDINEEDDDESETLEDGPLDEKTRMMRAKMQEMMEAAERRALGPGKTLKNATPAKSSLKKPATVPKTAEVDDDSQFDLTPYQSSAKPLSAKAIKAAAQAEREEKERARILGEARRRKATEAARREKREQARKKARREQEGLSTKQIGENKAVQILQPLLQSAGGLPPVLDSSQRVRGVNKTQTKFLKTAMKSSGTMTPRGWKSGRK